MSEGAFPFLDEVLEFRSALSSETDRGCALMAAAYLSDQLERLLRKMFVNDAAVVDELFQHLSPLGSFSGRIELAYALGLLPAAAWRDLHLVRKIRNEFGHVAKALTFEEPRIADRCKHFHHTAYGSGAKPRARFTNSVLGVCAVLHHAIYTVRQAEVPSNFVCDETFKSRVFELAQEMADQLIAESGGADPSPTAVKRRLLEALDRAASSPPQDVCDSGSTPGARGDVRQR